MGNGMTISSFHRTVREAVVETHDSREKGRGQIARCRPTGMAVCGTLRVVDFKHKLDVFSTVGALDRRFLHDAFPSGVHKGKNGVQGHHAQVAAFGFVQQRPIKINRIAHRVERTPVDCTTALIFFSSITSTPFRI